MTVIVPRLATRVLREFTDHFRVVIVNGPRQSGKTTLLELFQADGGGEFRSLDDEALLNAARTDPLTFVSDVSRPLLIDEVQRGGDALIRSIKLVVDRNQSPGQFVLSGSTRFLTVPTLSESLAGRAALVDMWPFTVAERTGGPAGFCDRAFADPESLLGDTSEWTRDDYLDLICQGGYPAPLSIPTPRARQAWYDSYLTTVVSRDITEFVHVQQTPALQRLLELVATRAGSPFVLADLARGVGMSIDTTRSYLSYLEMAFLVGYARAWSTNLTSKITKTPKAFVTDPGLAAHLVRASPDGLRRPGHPALGGLTESFVWAELTRLQSVSEQRFNIHHLRDRDGKEIDFILEGDDGQVVAIEVKASASPGSNAARHLHWLRDRLGDRLTAGIVLSFHPHNLSLGERIFSLPLSTLWGHQLPS